MWNAKLRLKKDCPHLTMILYGFVSNKRNKLQKCTYQPLTMSF